MANKFKSSTSLAMFKIIALNLCLFSTCFADLCPNLAIINVGNFIDHAGDTIDQVKKACGKPSSQKTFKKDIGPDLVDWAYFIPSVTDKQKIKRIIFSFRDLMLVNISVTEAYPTDMKKCISALKLAVYAFDQSIADKQCVKSITNQEDNVISTNLCSNIEIKKGAWFPQVSKACGEHPIQSQNHKQTFVEQTELQYKADKVAGVRLTFENNHVIYANVINK